MTGAPGDVASWLAARGGSESRIGAHVATAAEPAAFVARLRSAAGRHGVFAAGRIAELHIEAGPVADGLEVALAAPADLADPASLALLLDCAARPGAGPSAPASYPEFADWQRAHWSDAEGAAGRAHWRTVLAARPAPAPPPPAGLQSTVARVLPGAPDEATLLSAWRMVLERSLDAPPPLAVLCDPRDDPGLTGSVGPYSVPVPLSWQPDAAGEMAALCAGAARALAAARAHQVSFRPPDCGGSPGSAGLFWHRLGPAAQAGGPVRVQSCAAPALATGCDLQLWDSDGCVVAQIVHAPGRIDAVAASRLLDALAAWLGSGARPALRPVVGPGELAWQRRQLTGPSPRDRVRPPADRLAELARTAPDRLAIAEPEPVTFAELAGAADGLAAALAGQGVAPGETVGIALEQGAGWLTTALAVHRAGAAFVSVPPDLPPERRRLILEDAGVSHVVVPQDAGSGAFAPAAEVPVTARAECAGAVPAIRPGDPAYVIYTSGSTGRPKGVRVSHRAFTRYLSWAVAAYPLDGDAASPVHARPDADLGLTSVFVPLLQGRPLAFLPARPPGAALARRLERGAAMGLVKLTPSQLAVSPAAGEGAGIRQLVVGGEALPVRLLAGLARVGAIVNEYGPTEATVGCIAHRAGPQDSGAGGDVPIGRPIEGVSVYLLDRALSPVPQGRPGELYLSTEMLADGYVGRPRETAAPFLPDPFSASPGARMYRTGDLARLDRAGVLHFLSRADAQMKIRGHRIEPGEVEAALVAYPGVRGAVAFADPRGSGVAACIVVDAPIAPRALRRHLADRLIAAAVPETIVPIDDMPLTASGKLDRRAASALAFPPEPEPGSGPGPAAAPPEGPAGRIAAVFGGVLGRSGVRAKDNFFALGGHSLLVIRLVAELRREIAPDLNVRDVFDNPTPEGLAVLLQASGSEEGYL